jgi:hypothetical protein
MRLPVVALAACAVGCEPGDNQTVSPDASKMWRTLFDGQLAPGWVMSTIADQPGRDDPGRFDIVDGALVATPGTDLGLFWYTEPAPANFVLELEWRTPMIEDNSGVYVRFPHLDSLGYNNTAHVAINFGFEVQIYATERTDIMQYQRTGAIYGTADQAFSLVPAKPLGEWNHYRIRVVDQAYTVELNGTQTTQFTNYDGARGIDAPAYVGIQTHTGAVAFRAIRIRGLGLPARDAAPSVAAVTVVSIEAIVPTVQIIPLVTARHPRNDLQTCRRAIDDLAAVVELDARDRSTGLRQRHELRAARIDVVRSLHDRAPVGEVDRQAAQPHDIVERDELQALRVRRIDAHVVGAIARVCTHLEQQPGPAPVVGIGGGDAGRQSQTGESERNQETAFHRSHPSGAQHAPG